MTYITYVKTIDEIMVDYTVVEEGSPLPLYMVEDGTYFPVPFDFSEIFLGDAIYGTDPDYIHVPIPDTRFSIWNTLTKGFDTDQELYTPVMYSILEDHKISQIEVIVNYTNPSSVTFSALNTRDTRLDLLTIANGVVLDDDPLLTIDFEVDFNNDWATMVRADCQGLFESCFLRQQLCFSAKRAIQAAHVTTPYTDLATPLADFDTYISTHS